MKNIEVIKFSFGGINMLVKPTVLQLLTKVENRYILVTATARRARQISAGSKPLTMKEEPSPVSTAADEIAEGKVTIC
jgi:DNA-directed RNA polymerase subunit omega